MKISQNVCHLAQCFHTPAVIYEWPLQVYFFKLSYQEYITTYLFVPLLEALGTNSVSEIYTADEHDRSSRKRRHGMYAYSIMRGSYIVLSIVQNITQSLASRQCIVL